MQRVIICFFIISFLFIYTQQINAQCSWVMGSSETADYSADSWSLTYDDEDNYYVAGAFREEFTASGISFNAPERGQGYFVAKYNTEGEIIWGKVIEAFAESISFLPKIERIDDRLFIAGAASNDIIVDGVNYGDADLYNIFLIGMDTVGNFEFVHTFPDSASAAFPYVAGITRDNQNKIYITGRFSGYLNWGPVTATSSSHTTYVAKFNSNGNFIDYDKTSSPGAATSRGWAITADSDNNVIFGGFFQNTLSFNTCFQELTEISAGTSPYIVKMDSTFNCLWMIVGDKEQEFSPVYGITTDAENNIYACGNFKDTISFNGTILTDNEGTFFLLKLNSDGNVIWAKNFGNANTTGQAASSVNIDSAGNIWVTGWQLVNSNYGAVTLNGEGVFAVKLDSSGNVLEGIKGEGLATSYASEIDNEGNLIISGAAEGEVISFDDAEGYEYSSGSSKGFFILRYYLDSDSCIDDSIPDAINEIKIINDLVISPNPSNGDFSIIYESNTTEEADILIYDVAGKQIQSAITHIYSGENNIPIHIEPAPGYYTVKMRTQKQLYVSRVLIE
ncbi:MAG: T9SS type A sorting domain-containing protein [Fimbriimonadaceae bacterium]|nr:T9SS type A sorting domain-containing protein [Chitinophagales bacterium]